MFEREVKPELNTYTILNPDFHIKDKVEKPNWERKFVNDSSRKRERT